MGVRFLSGTWSEIPKQIKDRKGVIVDNKTNKDSGLNHFIENMKKDKMLMGYVISAAVIVVVLIIVIVGILISGDKAESSTGDENAQVEAEAEVENTELSDQTAEATFVDDGSLQENAYPEVNDLVNQYFTALAAGDTATVANLKSDTTDEELIKIEKKSAYIEAFENITVYTKLGNAEKSYITFVYYDINFNEVEAKAPGLTTLYICEVEDGSLHIYDGDLDEQTSERIKEAAAEADVVELFNRVEVAYNEAIEADATLKTFMDELPTKLDTEVAAALAEKEAAEAAANEATEAAANVEEPAAEEPAAPTTETVEANDTVNVRSSDSENADKLGKLDVGTRVTRYESKENGWSRIDYNGQEGYVKSEFLTVVSTESAEAPADSGDEQPAASEAPEGKVTIKETVNVRKSSGEEAEKIGVAYEGEHYDLLMKQADGWSKIQFGDKVGFVKSEFLIF